ncbi:phage baseplate assembly protein [Megasphaera elsdenii]|uniref:phage baseplate assembly protein n=1 Tax=Megasphaera elsdenii TaxID=907 RepID=UPI00206033F6|nr:phage baseplate assembly protein [Megasphaera elsdenii]DAY77692.1 MAG TPA: baseplate assembly protein V [Caudoviricetes sp.]
MATDAEIIRVLKRIFAFGRVSSVNAAEGTARVTFPDRGDKVSYDLPVGQFGAKDNQSYWMPAIDDQVFCIMIPSESAKGFTEGIVLCSIYSEKNRPPAGSAADTRVLNVPGNLLINVAGTLQMLAGTVDIQGGGDVVVGGISLVNHPHSGVMSGGSNTGKPVGG